jgi:hypothetical protein
MKIIALTGWSESGKDTVADILVNEYYFKKYAIAGPLKDLCVSLYGFPRELAETQEGKKTALKVGYKTKTVRELLLETGAIDRARFGDSVYINEIVNKISVERPPAVVISDLRYIHELHALQEYAKLHGDFFEVWRIVREGQTESPVKDTSEHILETLKCQQTILNDGKSLEILKEKVSEAISRKNELSTSQNEDDGCCVM